ncbi:MAG: hypothetical protein D6744_03175 [Planctomycetota bacterium]|nr:MAG: hypothetical protein D6744_03175 [Planctomycetota bacterium]
MSSNADSSSRVPRWPSALALTVALMLSVLSGVALWRFHRSLPFEQLRRVTGEQWNAAMRRTLTDAPQAVRDGWDMQGASSRILGLRFANSPRSVGTDLSQVHEMLANVRSSHLPRLQYAIAALLVLEQRDAPPEDRWKMVEPLLRGLENGDFRHHTQDLVAALAHQYRTLGLDDGTAASIAWFDFSFVHGPLVEFGVIAMERLAEQRAALGDESGATLCRRVTRRWLRQWVLLPGPAGLRLLAAARLAEDLQRENRDSAVARDLRAWRSAYHEHARRLPGTLLGGVGGPSVAPQTQQRFAQSVVWASWTASAALTAALVTLLGCWSLFTRAAGAGGRRASLFGVIAAGALVACGYAWAATQTDVVVHDLRADFSRWIYWPVHPFIAAAALLMLVVLCSRFLPHHGRTRTMTRLALTAWILLAPTASGLTMWADRARRAHSEALTFVLHDDYAAIAGAEPDRLLDSLRAWRP